MAGIPSHALPLPRRGETRLNQHQRGSGVRSPGTPVAHIGHSGPGEHRVWARRGQQLHRDVSLSVQLKKTWKIRWRRGTERSIVNLWTAVKRARQEQGLIGSPREQGS